MWEWRDAWILQSVVYGVGLRGGNLAKVIGAADHINVDIPSREDLETSVNRLAAAGLVHPEGTRLRATRAGRRVVKKAGSWRSGVRDLPPLIEAELRAIPFPASAGTWSLSQATWETAYDEYYPPEKRAGPRGSAS